MQNLETERPRTPQALFDRVAPYYDRMNTILSFGMDRRWRRVAAASLRLPPGARVLDVATGTGALATEIVRVTAGSVFVTGCDVNQQMLSVAKERARRSNATLALVHCDATNLPFAAESFDAVTIGFAIDDMPNRDACVREMRRVLRAGGRLLVLELGQPDSGLPRTLFQLYLKVFRVVSDGYRHLELEILRYRGADAIEELLTRSGFAGYARRSLTWGIARLHIAEKRIETPPAVGAST
jgi:demethylmenaquinone methyltransferase/2-methoxy-6-polyprenyl-1,4-benzoquinol methylase